MAKVGDVINGVRFEDEIGAGSSGVVFLGKKDKETMAVKMIRINRATQKEDKKLIQSEMDVGLSVGKTSPFLVDYKEIVMKEEECYIFFEYYPGGDLGKIIQNHVKENKPFSQEEICSFVYETGSGLKTLHDSGILHRDLKPSNIFLTASKMHKIGDYSLARYNEAQAGRSMTLAGTLGYIAPELLEGKRNYSFEVDIFSFGCIFWYMMFLNHPFSNPDGSINQRLLLLGTPTDGGHMTLCSQPLQDLARRMISLNPDERPNIAAVLALPLLANTLFETQIKALTLRMAELDTENAAVRKENEAVRRENEELKEALAEVRSQRRLWRGEKMYPVEGGGQNRYVGEFRDEVREGHGVITYFTGGEYNGQWANDKRTGNGVMVYKNGDKYTGGWVNGKREGKGKVTVPNPKDITKMVSYDGGWKADLKEGKGVMVFRNGIKYEGEFKGGVREGKAVVTTSNSVFVGNYVKGKRHGHGIITYKGGRKVEVDYENGVNRQQEPRNNEEERDGEDD